MKTRNMTIGMLVLYVMPGFGAARSKAAEKIEYQMKFEKGAKYYLRTTKEQTISETMMGQEQGGERTVNMGINFDIKNVDKDGNAWVDYAYDWIKVTLKGPMGEVVYDSSEKEATVPPMGQAYAVLVGESISLKMTPKGRVKEVKGLEKIHANIRKKWPESAMREHMIKAMEQHLSEEAVKESAQSTTAIYPDRPVGVGDTWSTKVVLSQDSPMIAENKWTLKTRAKGVATFEVKSVMKPNPDAKLEIMGTKITHELSGKQEGIIEIRESTGHLIRGKLSQQISGHKRVEGGGAQGQSMTIPVKIDSVVTLEMTERKKKK
ncbi:MAG: DUF6263 family protein [Planctomycetota bacterium]|jgi:hypothetical protein